MMAAIFPTLPGLEPTAIALAEELHLPLVASRETAYDYLLLVTPDYIGLQKTKGVSRPLYVDFLSGKNSYRAQRTSLKKEALARAMGLKANIKPTIVDATGGLARDAFLLASLGFEVTILERSPIFHALIADGILRAQSQGLACINRLQLIHADAISWLSQVKLQGGPDIIYLDPMFPERKKSALPSQEMRILHDIVGEDNDADALLKVALTCANQRVVVKRPRLAVALAVASCPSFALLGSSSRFDVYLT